MALPKSSCNAVGWGWDAGKRGSCCEGKMKRMENLEQVAEEREMQEMGRLRK